MRTKIFLNVLLQGFFVNFTPFLNFLSFACIPVKSWKPKGSDVTRIESPECTMMMLNDTGWMSTANKGLCHINSESPTLPEIFSEDLNHILACSVWVWRITTPSTEPNCKTAFRDILNWNTEDWHLCFCKQSPVLQHIHWRYCVDPGTSHNMRKKYWWVKPSRSTCNKNKPPQIIVNARQL